MCQNEFNSIIKLHLLITKLNENFYNKILQFLIEQFT